MLYFTGIKRGYETHKLPAGLCYCAFIVGNRYVNTVGTFCRRRLGIALCLVVAVGFSGPRAIAQSRSQDNEIVTSLTGGRVILHFAKEAILFAAVDQPVEQGAPPPRVVDVDGQHIAILFGASEWRSLADPKPIRMDRNVQRIAGRDPRDGSYGGEADPDLEQMGIEFLEKLRPLVSQLQRKIDFPADQPFFELIVIGYGPKNYGPEAWTVEYRITQQLMASALYANLPAGKARAENASRSRISERCSGANAANAAGRKRSAILGVPLGRQAEQSARPDYQRPGAEGGASRCGRIAALGGAAALPQAEFLPWQDGRPARVCLDFASRRAGGKSGEGR